MRDRTQIFSSKMSIYQGGKIVVRATLGGAKMAVIGFHVASIGDFSWMASTFGGGNNT